MILTKDLLALIKKNLEEMGYGEQIGIVRGHIAVQIQIDNNKVTVSIRDRELITPR